MPEVAEVSHVVAQLRRNVIGFKIHKLGLYNDPLLFPLLKNNPNAADDLKILEKSLSNATITSVGRHGKHFWLRLLLQNKLSGVLAMHFGMTGMIKMKNVESHLTFMENGGDKKVLEKMTSVKVEANIEKPAVELIKEEEEWPPRFSKLELDLVKGNETLELSYVDPRRLGRIRFLTGEDVETDEKLLKQEPFIKLGPDYSKDPSLGPVKNEDFKYGDPDPDTHGRDRLSLEEFNKLVLSKKKPIKALLQEQEYFAGIGNWVSDEIVYHARIHPEEVLSSKISLTDQVDPVIERLYNSIIEVCQFSVGVEGDVQKFPKDWLMLYRWGKRRKNGPKATIADGKEVDFITVGGRTSCYVPELQKKLGSKRAVVKEEETEERKAKITKPPAKKRQRKV